MPSKKTRARNPLAINPEREHRVRERAYLLWEADGKPHGRDVEYWERARQLVAMEESAGSGLLPNPLDLPASPREIGIEEAEIQENLGEFPDRFADQGEVRATRATKRAARGRVGKNSLPKLEVGSAGSDTRRGKPTTAQEIRNGILAHWGKTEITSTAMKILEFILTLDKNKRQAISFGDIAEWLGQKELTSEILSALNILVGSEFSILRPRGYFLSEDNERYELTPDDFRQVFRSGSLNHPRTGKPVQDPARHVVPVFELDADLCRAEA
jgi:Protein of unknown function (DUF2934)